MSETAAPGGGRLFQYERAVNFGDCDPAGIVFYPNFYRWFDEAVHAALEAAGWGWHRTARDFGWRGVSVADAQAHFVRPALHGDRLTIETRIDGTENRRIVFRHRVLRGTALICEGREIRFIAVPHPADPQRIQATDVPEDLRLALTTDPPAA